MVKGWIIIAHARRIKKKGKTKLCLKTMCTQHTVYVFNPNIVIDDHDYDGNHINGIIDLTDKGIGVRQPLGRKCLMERI